MPLIVLDCIIGLLEGTLDVARLGDDDARTLDGSTLGNLECLSLGTDVGP